jgi:asparagine synthase (glutamine-hydrolysing)
MCGIAGLIGRGVGSDTVRLMIETLAHRGPDGIRVATGEGFALGHARLSIIDLATGWQPLEAAGSTVIGNGEIYNYVELTQDFDLKDVLATGSDFEPLLHLYGRERSDAFDRLRGMFGLFLLGDDGCRWLVRDGFGIKPLYWAEVDGALAFASEPRALFAAGVKRTIDPVRAEELLALGYTLGDQTIFKDVQRLAPGAVLSLKEPAVVKGKPPLSPVVIESHQLDQPWLAQEPRRFASDEEAVEALDAVLEDSVRVHQRADVPYGLFLSGGIDSAAIATLMSRLNERPVVAFTCGFQAEGAKDERSRAETVARALDLDWREVSFGEEDFWTLLPQVVEALDEPTTDYACLPTFKLAQAAKGSLKVVLTGEGGDELFGGYSRYRRALRPRWLGGRPAEPRVKAPHLRDKGAGALDRWTHQAFEWTTMYSSSPLQGSQIADIKTWLHADLLLKLDRCLMAHGLEGRTPFLDSQVASFALPLPDRLKVRGNYGKWILRKWLERHCPAADPWARKQGFTVPVGAWIAPRARDLGPRIAAIEGVAQICDPDTVRAVFAEAPHAKARWPLLFYALWWQIHVAGIAPADALEALAGRP